MKRIAMGMITALALACGGGVTTQPDTHSTSQEAQTPPPSAPSLSRCEPSAAQPVASFQELPSDPDTVRTVDVRFDPTFGEWMPSPQLDMPLHHATRIVWIDEPAHDALTDARDRLLRISFVVVDHQLEQSHHEGILIEATYRLRVVDVCEAPG